MKLYVTRDVGSEDVGLWCIKPVLGCNKDTWINRRGGGDREIVLPIVVAKMLDLPIPKPGKIINIERRSL